METRQLSQLETQVSKEEMKTALINAIYNEKKLEGRQALNQALEIIKSHRNSVHVVTVTTTGKYGHKHILGIYDDEPKALIRMKEFEENGVKKLGQEEYNNMFAFSIFSYEGYGINKDILMNFEK